MKSLVVVFLFLFSACQTVKLLKNQDLASQKFLDHIREAKSLSNEKQYKQAWAKLGELNEWKLNDTENALADNLRGSILFKVKNLPKAEKYFQRALLSSVVGSEINSQVRLNLATLYYKQDDAKKSWEMLGTIQPESLYEAEKGKFHLFKFKLSKKLDAPKEGVRSLIGYFKPQQTYKAVNDNPISQHLVVEFSKLSQEDQIDLIEEIQDKNFAEVFIIQKYLNEYLYLSRSSVVEGLIERLVRYTDDPEAQRVYAEFLEAKEGSQSFDNMAIGVVVPLSGKMARFGRSVLKGIDLALFDLYGDKKPKVFVKDSYDNAVAARLAVKSLIEENRVSYIVGGVFTKTASEEFLEAKKYGTMFFSLSPIYLSFTEKNSLLFEVFGSIESQVAELFSDENLERNGQQFVMAYPQTEAGRAYHKEVLRQSLQKEATLVDSISIEPGQTDYREDIKKLLGVGYVKQLIGEEDELDEGLKKPKEYVYIPVVEDKTDKKDKKAEILELDFSWAFVPALPNDALQVIPNFRYFEARGLNYYGVPSWRTRTFLNRHIGLGNLFFVSSENSILQERFNRLFYDRFNQRSGVVESMAYESVSLGKRLIGEGYTQRAQVVRNITNLKFIEGFSSSWQKQDGIWFKDMDTFKISNRRYRKVF